MKKLFLTLALAIFAVAASAQITIGGNLGFNTDKQTGSSQYGTTVSNDDPYTISTYEITPKIGYWFNDKMQLGIALGYTGGLGKRVDADNSNNWYKITASRISLQPYFRYNAAHFNNLTFFVEASLPISIMPASKTVVNMGSIVNETVDNEKESSFGLNVVPGFNYSLNSKMSIDLYLNVAQFFFKHTTTTTDNTVGTTTDIDTEIHNSFGLGVYTLQPTFSLSFNYTL